MRISTHGMVALRRLYRRRAVSLALIAVMALGLAASTTAFSVLDAVVLHPYDWRSPESLVAVYSTRLDRRTDPRWARTWNRQGLSWQVWSGLQKSIHSTRLAAWYREMPLVLGQDRAALVSALGVSSNLLPLLGVPIVLGRGFSENEDREPSESILLSERMWRGRFGARSDIVGTRLEVSRYMSRDEPRARTVIGVVSARFRLYGDSPDVLLPIGDRARETSWWGLKLIGRTAPAASSSTLQAAVAGAIGLGGAPWPMSARVVPLASDQAGGRATALWLLFGIGILLLAISVSNVASLLLAEAETRRPELLLRLALGAGFRDLLKQVMAELLLVGVASMCIGTIVAGWHTSMIVAHAPAGLPELADARSGWRSLLFSCGVGGLAFVCAGVMPVLSLRRSCSSAIACGNSHVTPRSGTYRQRALILFQVSLATVMIVIAALLAENVRRLEQRPLGFDPRDLLLVSVQSTDPAPQVTDLMVGSALEGVRRIPGVVRVASVTAAPFEGQAVGVGVRVGSDASEELRVQRQLVSANYFATMAMRPLEGRLFRDTEDDPAVAVVSDSFAREVLGGRAVGKRITENSGRVLTVVGSVCDVRERSQEDEVRPTYYVLGKAAYGVTTIVVRFLPEVLVVDEVRTAIATLWPNGVVTRLVSMESMIDRSLADHRFRRSLAVVLGVAAGTLSLLGLYGLMTRRVAQRRRELGIRAALGASPRRLATAVLGEALAIGVSGTALGIVVSVWVSQAIRGLLVAVSPVEPVVLALAVVGAILAALGAVIAPAAAAWRADAVEVLRE